MAVESPANIVVIGHNPLALEAALYGRFMGYSVQLLGHSDSATGLFRAPPIQTSSTLNLTDRMTPLGRRAILAQDPSLTEEELFQSVTCENSYHENYLNRLAGCDLLSDSLVGGIDRLQVTVIEDELPEEWDTELELDPRVFQIQVLDPATAGPVPEASFRADVLIDMRTSSEQSSVACEFDFGQPAGPSAIDADREEEGDMETHPGGVNAGDPRRLLTGVDDFYLLGERSPLLKGSLYLEGLFQVRDLFKIICDREQLDLYQG